ncbi:hypothetical protein [Pseudomonas sp. 1152_12]
MKATLNLLSVLTGGLGIALNPLASADSPQGEPQTYKIERKPPQ